MKDFKYWENLHRNEQLEEFNLNRSGLLWLKLKSIIRKDLIGDFAQENLLNLHSDKLTDIFEELFITLSSDVEKSHSLLDKYIISISRKQIESIDVSQIVSELYKLKHFDWGGDYQNSLDKYLVSRYVKSGNPSYDYLLSKFEAEINPAVRGYVLNSWYNYWSSVLIENIFKSHPAVLPTVGQIKNVDFFINNIPFDLKITYLPATYIKQKRKEKSLPAELVYLKQKAKEADIDFDKKARDNDAIHEITEKMKDRNNAFCNNVLQSLKSEKLYILQQAQANPKTLAKWLYENQGEMRFGSENRLFLVLVDTDNFNDSWKLKRNIDLLKPILETYLDNFSRKDISDLQVSFKFKDKPHGFTALADVIFAIK